MAITYKVLFDVLQDLPDDHLYDHISIMINGEFYEIGDIGVVTEESDHSDVLDVGHLYLCLMEEESDDIGSVY